MTIDYSFYYRAYFVIPVAVILICLCVFAFIIPRMVHQIKRKRKPWWSMIHTFGGLIIILSFFLYLSGATLTSGGVHLYREDESSAKTAEGIIEKIERTGKHEYRLFVNNEQYIIAEIGSYSEGNEIQYTYLPKSKFILAVCSESNAPDSMRAPGCRSLASESRSR